MRPKKTQKEEYKPLMNYETKDLMDEEDVVRYIKNWTGLSHPKKRRRCPNLT